MKTKIITDINDIEQVVIDNEDGTFTSMSKATFDAIQAEQSTPIDTLPSKLAEKPSV
jgi:hypothetical protein